MQSHSTNFAFDPNWDFGTAPNIFIEINQDKGTPFPMPAGNFELFDGTFFLLLNGGFLELL
jgi:hypothetical protein